MNKARRAIVEKIIGQLEEVQEEEQEAYDNLPENFQDGEKGESMLDAIDYMAEALAALVQI